MSAKARTPSPKPPLNKPIKQGVPPPSGPPSRIVKYGGSASAIMVILACIAAAVFGFLCNLPVDAVL